MKGIILLYVLAGIVVIGIDVYIAWLFQNAAEEKGHGDQKYFWICLLLGLPGWIYVAALPDVASKRVIMNALKELKPQTDAAQGEQRPVLRTPVTHEWRCKRCGSMISELPCAYCGSDQ